jgi:tetratricopeptide (TPR) repeat protein
VLGEEPGGLFWLFQAVSEMAAAEWFEATPQGFAFRAGAKPALPVPAELRTALIEKLRASGEHQLILESAALLGEVFSVNTLAAALNLDRLELLQRLRSLEQSAHIVSDLPDDEDGYAFSSAFMFETVRDELGISSTAARRPSKLVQELHARVAAAIEASGDEKSAYALARHWSMAGARHAAKSFTHCRKASRQARDVFAFDESRRWLTLAEQAARTLGEPFDAALEQLRIDCEESHVRGRDRSATAERAWQLVSEQSDVPHDVLVVAARACYDAYRDTGLAAWHERAVSLARRIIDVSTDALEKAAGHHLLGVSLPIAGATERLAALRQGLTLVEAEACNEPASASLEARLLGSLGEALSYGETADRTAARECFERSLDLRVSRNLGDLPGQARAHGGLGRLALSDDPPDYGRARKHFVEDLRISETIDDSAGISMSHCSLGRCDRAAGDMAGAARHFAQAFETARSVKDRCFAMIGKLELAIDMKRADEAQQLGRELLEMSKRDALPASCVDELLRVLFADGSIADTDWAKSLIATVNSKEVAAS